MKQRLPLLLVILSLGWQLGMAQTVPPLMNYQGRLTDEAGSPLPDGNYQLAFRLYSNPSPVAEEALIWGRQYQATLLNGAFNIVLGASGGVPVVEEASVNDLTFAFTEANRYLELRVVSDHTGAEVNRTILPRQQLLSVPYAIEAGTLRGQTADMLTTPPGTIVAFGGVAVPPGWLLCDGSALSRDQYPQLHGAILQSWGNGTAHSPGALFPAITSGETKTDFNLPDLRGTFLRGVSGPLTSDPQKDSRGESNPGGNTGNNVGSLQGDATRRPNTAFTTSTGGVHTHGIERTSTGTTITWGDGAGSSSNRIDAGGSNVSNSGIRAREAGAHTHSITGGGDAETRPQNAYVHYIIKY